MRTPPKTKEKEKEKAKKISPSENKKAPPLPDGLRDAMERFKEHRKQMKAPMTEYAVSLMLTRLEKLSGGSETKKIAILEQSIERGWKGVFTLDEDKPSQPARQKSVKHNYPQHSFTDDQLDKLLTDLDDPAIGAKEGAG